MTHILLCDDEEAVINKTKLLIEKYHMQNEKGQFFLYTFNNPIKFLESYKINEGTLIFLDIGMNPISGIELAQRIRAIDKQASIVFLTGFTQYFQNALNIHAFDYIVKPVTEKNLFHVLNEYYSHRQEILIEPSPYFIFSNNHNNLKIEIDKIYYIEQFRNVTTIASAFSSNKIYATLKEIKPMLPSYFVQCHKSYIVNLKKVETRVREFCYLSNGKSIPIGRLKQKEFKELYVNFLDEFKKEIY